MASTWPRPAWPDYGKPGNYFARQIVALERAVPGQPARSAIPAMDALIAQAAGALPGRRRRGRAGARRLPHRQPDVRIPTAPRVRRGGGLGAVDAGPSARRPGLPLHGACACRAIPRCPAWPALDRAALGIPDEAGDARALQRTQRAPDPGRLAVRAGLQFLPPGGDRAGRGQARATGQCLQRHRPRRPGR